MDRVSKKCARVCVLTLTAGLGWFASVMPASATSTSTDTTPPSAPSQVSGTDGYGAYIVWKAAADNVTPANKMRYVVYADSVENRVVFDGETFANYFNYDNCVSLLVPGTHTYTVRALDEAGNESSASNGVVLGNS